LIDSLVLYYEVDFDPETKKDIKEGKLELIKSKEDLELDEETKDMIIEFEDISDFYQLKVEDNLNSKVYIYKNNIGKEILEKIK
jgi:hypothetical protein